MPVARATRGRLGPLEPGDARLARIAEASGAVPWEWDLASDEHWWGPSLEPLFGWSREDLEPSAESWRSRVHPEDRARVLRRIEDAIAGSDDEWWDAYRFLRSDGSFAWVLDRGRVVRDRNGRPLRMIGSVMDTTRLLEQDVAERARSARLARQNVALAELSRSTAGNERALPELVENSARTLGVERVSVWLFDASRQTIECADLFELTPTRHSSGLRLLARDYPAYFAALEEGRTITANDARTDPRTSEFAADYLDRFGISSMLDAPVRVGGRVAGVVCHEHVGDRRRWEPDEESFAASVADFVAIALEERARKRAEEEWERAERALRRSETRYRTLAETSTDVIARHDVEGRFLYASPAAMRLFGFDPASLVGRSPCDLVPEEDAAQVRDAFARAIAGPETSMVSYRVARADGSVAWVETTARAVRNPVSGEPHEVVTVTRDVSERLRAEKELEAARRQIAQSEKLSALGSLVSGVAHEIRTPLTYLSNNLFVIRSRLARVAEALPPGREKESFLALEASVNASLEGASRINLLVEDLRRFTRLRTRERAPASLSEVVGEAVSLFRATHRGQATIEADLEPTRSLPMDRVQIQQVVINLLENAMDASAEGKPIRVATWEDASSIALEVRDQGMGIPPEIEARMWDPFFTTKSEGTGLGLAIVRRIVEGHGWTIACQTAPGVGTTFTVRAPR